MVPWLTVCGRATQLGALVPPHADQASSTENERCYNLPVEEVLDAEGETERSDNAPPESVQGTAPGQTMEDGPTVAKLVEEEPELDDERFDRGRTAAENRARATLSTLSFATRNHAKQQTGVATRCRWAPLATQGSTRRCTWVSTTGWISSSMTSPCTGRREGTHYSSTSSRASVMD